MPIRRRLIPVLLTLSLVATSSIPECDASEKVATFFNTQALSPSLLWMRTAGERSFQERKLIEVVALNEDRDPTLMADLTFILHDWRSHRTTHPSITTLAREELIGRLILRIRLAVKKEDEWLDDVASQMVGSLRGLVVTEKNLSAIAILSVYNRKNGPLVGEIIRRLGPILKTRTAMVTHRTVIRYLDIRNFLEGRQENIPETLFKPANRSENAALRQLVFGEMIPQLAYAMVYRFQQQLAFNGLDTFDEAVAGAIALGTSAAREFHLRHDLARLGLRHDPVSVIEYDPNGLPDSSFYFKSLTPHLYFLREASRWYLWLAGISQDSFLPLNRFGPAFESADSLFKSIIETHKVTTTEAFRAMRQLDSELHNAKAARRPVILRTVSDVVALLQTIADVDESTRTAWLARTIGVMKITPRDQPTLLALSPDRWLSFTSYVRDFRSPDYATFMEAMLDTASAQVRERFPHRVAPVTQKLAAATNRRLTGRADMQTPRDLLLRFLDRPQGYQTNFKTLAKEFAGLPIKATNDTLNAAVFIGVLLYESPYYRLSNYVGAWKTDQAFRQRLMDIIDSAPWGLGLRVKSAWSESQNRFGHLQLEFPSIERAA